jgi:hypothetical protein
MRTLLHKHGHASSAMAKRPTAGREYQLPWGRFIEKAIVKPRGRNVVTRMFTGGKIAHWRRMSGLHFSRSAYHDGVRAFDVMAEEFGEEEVARLWSLAGAGQRPDYLSGLTQPAIATRMRRLGATEEQVQEALRKYGRDAWAVYMPVGGESGGETALRILERNNLTDFVRKLAQIAARAPI